MDSKRVRKARVSTTIRLSGNYQSGNTEKTSATIAAVAAVEDSIKEFSSDVKFTYGENAHKINQREFFGGVTYDYLPLSKLSPFARIELYSNMFKKINMRHSGLAGVKYRYFTCRKPSFVCDYSISTALIYDNEDYTKDAKVPDTNKFRLSLRPKFKQSLMKNIALSMEFYYKPNIAKFDDYRIENHIQMDFSVNRHISLQFAYQYEYNSQPATKTVKNTDTMFQTFLDIKF